MKPSYFSFCLSALLLFVFVVVLGYNTYQKNELDQTTYHTYVLLLLASIAVGIHGLGHAYAEVNFGFDPLTTGNFTY